MDAVWKVEDKTKISTMEAVAVFAFIIILIVLVTILILVALKTRRKLVHDQPEAPSEPTVGSSPANESSSGEGVTGRRNSQWPVLWQRPILMGEKCELPQFSGLILYDERGILAPGRNLD